jgi:parvulin-like peptidyl-prolyl isomerase
MLRFERQLLGNKLLETRGEAKLARLALKQSIDENLVQEQLQILQAQFPEGEWENALAAAGIRPGDFVSRFREHQRVLAWIEQEIGASVRSRQSELEAYYEDHRPSFVMPLRRRARHIFFAAPNGSAPLLVEEKQKAAEAVLDRLAQGEEFAAIATESEDEATRDRGGDLNFFAENRILPEIWNALSTQKIGGAAILARSHLGFHVIQLTDERPSREIPISEASAEVAGAVENGKRLLAVDSLAKRSE